ncbi:TPA: peptidase [Morganella morganii]|nr:MAG TPA: stabilization protein [Caudoviricetes sp.]HAT1527619.1 peptidase [Morganella morganii]HCR3446162.1 peptidase [Morganella morganii]HDF2364429.1 peptidase [Morganella morganii]HDF2423051.1 peptidase [Morganella morganii]
MNLWQRLMMRRLCEEQNAEGGDNGGAATGADNAQAGADTSSADNGGTPAGNEQNKGAEQQAKDQKADPGKSAVAAPEKYEFKTAEGQELDAEAVKAFEPIAKELNLSNEQAQKLVDVYGSKIMPKLVEQQAAQWQQQIEQWAEQVKADKDLGTDASIGAAQKAMDKFGSPELKQYLNETGLGNHPELVRIFANIGKAMSEDGLVTGNSGGAKSAADVLFG